MYIKLIETSKIQSILFDKDKHSKEQAKSWLKSHGYKDGEPDTTENNYRFRQEEPSKFKNFRTSEEKGDGIKFIYGVN